MSELTNRIKKAIGVGAMRQDTMSVETSVLERLCTHLERLEAEKHWIQNQPRRKRPQDVTIDGDDIGCFDVERSNTTGHHDNLATALAWYFENHNDRPEDDKENENNHWLGDWVLIKSNEAMALIAEQVNERLAKKARLAEKQAADD